MENCCAKGAGLRVLLGKSLVLIAALCLVSPLLSACSGSKDDDLQVAKMPRSQMEATAFLPLNQDKPGTPVNVQRYLVPGKYTIVEYFSPYNDACATLAPKLERLTQVRNDVAVRIIDVNRPGAQGVDWQSPVMQAEQIQALPYFQIYDPSQNLRAHGRPAYEQVAQWVQ